MIRDKWAKETSFNKNIKVYLGAPGSSKAAGDGISFFIKYNAPTI